MNDVIDQQPGTGMELAPPRDTAVMPGFNSNSSWELAQRIGKAFAASSLVPAQYQNNLANCIVALEMANRMGASPLMVMQNLYIVHGNPGWSSKYLIACFNQSGKYSALRYEWNAKRDGCRAWANEKATGERLVGPEVTIEMAKLEGWSTKSGSKWKTMPELMLMYRAAAFMIRTYAPEISMGLRTDDELIDITPEPMRASGLSAVRAALAGDAPPALPATPAPEPMTYAQFAEAIKTATDADTASLVLDEAKDHLPQAQQAELAAVFNAAWGGAA